MKMHATSTFAIDTWEAVPYDEQDGVSLSRTRVTKTFHGDIEGHSTAELLMAGAQDGSGAYVGLERIVGSIQGRAGSFVLHHSATMTRATPSSAAWTIVPDSGTGELRTLRGEAAIINEPDGGHTFTLDYELD
jgi:hypothetical protein